MTFGPPSPRAADRKRDAGVYLGSDLLPRVWLWDSIEPGRTTYLRFSAAPGRTMRNLRIDLEVRSGGLELLCSQTDVYCDQRGAEWRWVATTKRSLEIPLSSAGGTFYFAIVGHPQAQFGITVSTERVVRRSSTDAHASTVVPSRKTLQAALDAKLQALKHDTTAMSLFQQRVKTIREQAQTARVPGRVVSATLRPGPPPEERLWAVQAPDETARQLEERYRLRDQRLREVTERHERRERERVEQLLESAALREEERLRRMARARENQLNMVTRDVQIKWLTLSAILSRTKKMELALKAAFRQRVQAFSTMVAVRRLQKWIRKRMAARRKQRAQHHLESLRTAVRLCAMNLYLVRRHRAADVLKLFLYVSQAALRAATRPPALMLPHARGCSTSRAIRRRAWCARSATACASFSSRSDVRAPVCA
jgi:hypothetical protein